MAKEMFADIIAFLTPEFQANKNAIKDYVERRPFYQNVFGHGKDTESAHLSIMPSFLFYCSPLHDKLRMFKIAEKGHISSRHNYEFKEAASFSPRPFREICYLFDAENLLKTNTDAKVFPKYYCPKEFTENGERYCAFFGDNEWKRIKGKKLGNDKDKYYDLPHKDTRYFVDYLYLREGEWLIDGKIQTNNAVAGITVQNNFEKNVAEIILPLMFRQKISLEDANTIGDTLFAIEKKVKIEGKSYSENEKRYYSFDVKPRDPFHKNEVTDIFLCRLNQNKQRINDHTFEYAYSTDDIKPKDLAERECRVEKGKGEKCYVFEDKEKKKINDKYNHCIRLNKDGYSLLKQEGKDVLIDNRYVIPFYEGDTDVKMLGLLGKEPFIFDRFSFS